MAGTAGLALPVPQSTAGTLPPLQVLGVPLYQGVPPPAQGEAQPAGAGAAASTAMAPNKGATNCFGEMPMAQYPLRAGAVPPGTTM